MSPGRRLLQILMLLVVVASLVGVAGARDRKHKDTKKTATHPAESLANTLPHPRTPVPAVPAPPSTPAPAPATAPDTAAIDSRPPEIDHSPRSIETHPARSTNPPETQSPYLPLVLIGLLGAAIAGLLLLTGLGATFRKAGQPGWAALVPVYNLIVLLRVAGRPTWWIILLLIPPMQFVFSAILCCDVAKRFGKGFGFGLGLWLLGWIFFPILGVGSVKYRAPARPKPGVPARAAVTTRRPGAMALGSRVPVAGPIPLPTRPIDIPVSSRAMDVNIRPPTD